MKKCPYCAEEIQEAAVKCRFCNEFLIGKSKNLDKTPTKWYFSTHAVVIALMCVGPFALPLIILNPRYKLATRIIVSVAILALSIWLYFVTKRLLGEVTTQLNELNF